MLELTLSDASKLALIFYYRSGHVLLYRCVIIEGAIPQIYFIVDSPLREKHDDILIGFINSDIAKIVKLSSNL